MRKQPQNIASLLPQALATLARPTQPSQQATERATKWLLSGKFGWTFVGNETLAEKEKLSELAAEGVRWLSSFIDGLEPYWLVMVGQSGTGKTMMAKRLAEYVTKFGYNIFTDTIKKNDDKAIYSYYQEGSVLCTWRSLVPYGPDNQARIERSKQDWVKVIDDLKPQTGSEVEIEGHQGIKPKFFESSAAGDLLDARLRKWTVLTSNLTRSQLALFWDVRIASRLLRDGNTIVDLSNVRDFGLRREAATKAK